MSARNFARNSANNFRRIAVLLVLLLSFAFGAKAAQYTISYGNNYLGINNGEIANINPYNATNCVWTGPDGNNGRFSMTVNGTTYYLRYNNGLTVTTNQSNATSWTIDGERLYYRQNSSNYYYINYNNYNNYGWSTNRNSGNGTLAKVTYKDPTGITAEGVEILVGEEGQITYNLTSTSGTPVYDNVTFSINNTSIATINATTGVVTGLSAGTATVTVTAKNQNGNTACTATCSVVVKEPVTIEYVFYYNGYYLAINDNGTDIEPVAEFDPETCIWRGVETGTGVYSATVDGTTYYLQLPSNYDFAITTNINQATRWTRNGNKLYSTGNRYVRYNNGWTTTSNSGNSGTEVLYPITKIEGASTVEYSVGKANVSPETKTLDYLGMQGFTAQATVTKTTRTETYRHNSSQEGIITIYDETSETLSPTGYDWNLSSTENLTLGTGTASTNSVTYSTASGTTKNVTLSVTAYYMDGTSKKQGTAGTATITVNEKKDDPTGITAEDLTLAVDEQKSIRYFLTPSNAYDNIAYSGNYNGIISIDANGVVKGLKAGITEVTLTAKNLNGTNSAHSATSTVTVTPKAPTIEFSLGANITATISTTETGATIYYTTDGTTPTTSSSVYTAPVLVTAGATVKAIVVVMANSTQLTSPVAEALAMAESGIVGNTVFLYDFEDHNWTYYSGVAESVDGGNYNDNYVGKLYSPNPRNVKITYNGVNGISGSATDVRVSISENENSFVYYKTLEQGSTQGEYPYTVISNPFSVRPSTGSNNSKVYYGFAGWKIVSGGEYIKNYNNNDVLPLDANIVFENLPYNSVNCISANIVFETTWKQANRTYVSSNPSSNPTYSTNGDYESNFYVINCNYTRNITASGPVTIMMVEPDGSADYTGNSFSGSITPTADGNTKIEFAHWKPGSAINPQGRNFTIGRGMVMDGTRRALYGTNTSSSAVNQILKVESGSFSTFTHYGVKPSSITKQWITLGCDYDRANNNDNSKLTFTEKFIVGASIDLNLSSTVTTEMCRIYSLSGSFMTNVDISTGAADNSYYLCVSGTHNNGHRYLEVQGGEWYANIAGGMGKNQDKATRAFTFRMKGGIIRGSVYGAGAFAPAGGERRYIITGGNIGGWVAAGCNGIGGSTTSENNGATNGDSYVYVGGNARIGYQSRTINDVEGGNVFGAGRGAPVTTYNVGTINNSNVVVADKAEIEKNVYGGGNYGLSLGEANIYITGGSVDGRVFGGANMTKGYTPTIVMSGGFVKDGVYGGCNTEGTINNSVTMRIHGGQVGTSTTPANIHGGGYGQATRVSGNVDITLGTVGQASDGVTVYGDVYGGSALGYVNGTTANDNYHTYVTLNKGTINGSLYGGGLGSASVAANVYGPVKVTVNGGSVKTTDGTGENGSGGVYGANNIYGAPQSSVTVDVYGTDPAPAEGQYALHSVYGGGNKAPYNGTPIVTVHKCDNSIEYVYGGGNAASVNSTNVTIWGGNKIGNVFGGGNGTVSAANVNGGATTKIYGGTILNVFGGSNSQGTIGGTINVTVNSQAENGGDTPCTMNIGDVYGGGNRAASNVGNLNIVCTGTDGYINRVFGGANAAEITGNIELAINGGNIGSVFGGNNSEQSIEGDVTVNIGTAPNACGIFEIGNVHGGGYGKATGVTGNVEVNIAGGTINGDVYGGSALGKVNTNTSNTTAVNLTGGVIHGDAYGGGLGDSHTAADVNGNVTVTLNGTAFTLATTTDDDGNIIPTSGRVFGCNNINGSPKGTVLVKVLKTVARDGANIKQKPAKDSGIYELQAVYGGGNLAAYNPTNPTANGQFTSYTWDENSIPHDNQYKPLQVVIDGCDKTSIEYVYGGGNAAATPATDVLVLGSYEIGNVFGGGNGKDRYTLDGGTTWNENNGADVGIIDAAAYAADHTKGLYGTGKSKASVLGGTVHNLFGASNTKGNVVTESLAYVDDAGICTLDVGGIYGGGNEAYMDGDSKIVLGCIEALEEIYGGARNADVKGDINLTISSGHFDRVFGGNNIGGTINGSITVTIEETGCNPISIGELYGCGNQAAYTTPAGKEHPTINLKSFTSIGNVFGGGLGEDAVVTGNPTVNINVVEGANSERDWAYNGQTITFSDGSEVTLPTHEKGKIGAIGNVFGGGNAAAVIGNTQVNIGTVASSNADIRGNVYGGGNQANVTGQTNVVIGQ